MEIFNTDTNEVVSLLHSDECIKFNSEREIHEADTTAIDWWKDWVESDAVANEMSESVPSEIAELIDAEAGNEDMGNQPTSRISQYEDWAKNIDKKFVTYSDGSIGLEDLTDDDNMLTVKVDEENNAEEFWSNLRKQLPNLATRFGSHNSEVEMESSEWEAVQAIEGFFGGPDHAPTALVLA